VRRLHEAVSARVDDLTAAMVEEYGGVVQFARPIVETGINAFLAAEKGVREFRGRRAAARPRSRWSRSAWPV
jgi:aldehyde dehydrogenase (NAD+)